uniref:NADH dehydrogenase subunit 5 n=1 Tax=Rhabdias kafunata TaxID=2605646 RepID=UPI0023D815B2|nr:NADH dehydrogenase subunit 5 [Rhabdias kafunata]WCQ82414.1 NADH dehydrogenase subunit 5 [Rhabdias kafunata]
MNFFIFLISLFFFFGCVCVWLLPEIKLSFFFLEWDFMSLKFNLSFNSVLFSFILFLVTLGVLIFSTYYMNSELNFSYYCFMLLIFVMSMFMLNFSNSVYTMMLSWDLLGISSFFLVLFYNNWDSCSGAMNTALTNRLGDYFMFIFFCVSIFSGYYFLSLSMFSFYIILMLLLAAFTKSAQFPFSSWLPKAMSAPTPVSSLVHSSTLVTAGLILLLNFDIVLLNKGISTVILIIGLFTMFFSSIAALVEEDLKKVVALSTLSQMGFSMLTLGLGLGFISFLHLVSHALFKSCLFMQVGYIIHCSFGQQDGRGYGNNGNLPMFIQLQLLVTLFCLCGLVFSSGAVSKDFILEFFFSNFFMIFFNLMFFMSVFMTFGYSYRLWKSFFLSFDKFVNNYSNSFMVNFLSLLLVIFSVFFLWWMNMNMLNIPSLFLYIDFYTPLFYVFMMVFVSYMVLKVIFKELIFKFLVDYLAKKSIYVVTDIKFMDLFLNGINLSGYSFFSYMSLLSNMYLKSNGYGVMVFLIFFLFLLY